MPEPLPVAQLSYQQAADELDAIVDGLDVGSVDIDTLSEQFQRAIDLIEELDRRITTTRSKVDRLSPRLEAFGSGDVESS